MYVFLFLLLLCLKVRCSSEFTVDQTVCWFDLSSKFVEQASSRNESIVESLLDTFYVTSFFFIFIYLASGLEHPGFTLKVLAAPVSLVRGHRWTMGPSLDLGLCCSLKESDSSSVLRAWLLQHLLWQGGIGIGTVREGTQTCLEPACQRATGHCQMPVPVCWPTLPL